MDPFEEFEIKPLSDGLGFHKKAVPLADQVKKSGLTESQTVRVPSLAAEDREKMDSLGRPQAFSDLLKALETPVAPRVKSATAAALAAANEIMITEPLPAPGTAKKRAMEVEIQKPHAPEFPNLNPRPKVSPLNKVVENVGMRRGAADSPITMLEKAPVSIAAAVLDGVVIFALSLMFLVVLMTVTRVDLASLIFQVGMDVPTKMAFLFLFGSVLLMYVVVVRSFFGRTLGEWTFDYQMGNDEQHESAWYPVKVLWRSLLVIATGVVTLPILSLIFRRDLLAALTGLQLYRMR